MLITFIKHCSIYRIIKYTNILFRGIGSYIVTASLAQRFSILSASVVSNIMKLQYQSYIQFMLSRAILWLHSGSLTTQHINSLGSIAPNGAQLFRTLGVHSAIWRTWNIRVLTSASARVSTPLTHHFAAPATSI